MIKFISFSLIWFSLSWSNTYINRLKVPIDFQISSSIGYDQNFLKLSKSDLLLAELFPSMIAGSENTNSLVTKYNFKLEYAPYLIRKHKSKINLNYIYNLYNELDIKSFNKFSVSISQHIAPYRWLKFHYKFMPNYYLRNYVDKDVIFYYSDANNGGDIPPCVLCDNALFTDEIIGLEYIAPFEEYKKTYYSVGYSIIKQYYNSAFNEYDLDIREIKFNLNIKLSKNKKINLFNSFSKANNITQSDYQHSTYKNDRGYSGGKIKFSYSEKIKLMIVDNYGISLKIANRKYTSKYESDHLHYGRRHSDLTLGIWMNKNLFDQLLIKCSLNYRSKNTSSEYDYVERIKSFSKYDIWLSLFYNFEILPY